MTMNQNPTPIYDLEERTAKFARDVRVFIRNLPKTIANIEDGKQVVRSSGSIGANYLEANDSLSKKDLVMRMKISRKEAKETCYWLNLIYVEENSESDKQKTSLQNEAKELMLILGSIIQKLEK
ncbi:MAG: four helix bundle protein [Patescibacteria group bacterium]|jgi:four helix bundle protein